MRTTSTSHYIVLVKEPDGVAYYALSPSVFNETEWLNARANLTEYRRKATKFRSRRSADKAVKFLKELWNVYANAAMNQTIGEGGTSKTQEELDALVSITIRKVTKRNESPKLRKRRSPNGKQNRKRKN